MTGLRMVLFATGFNALLWVSRLTVGAWLARLAGLGPGLAAAALAPVALLAIGARTAPRLRAPMVAVAALSIACAGLFGAP